MQLEGPGLNLESTNEFTLIMYSYEGRTMGFASEA